jgi:hypothetical protein
MPSSSPPSSSSSSSSSSAAHYSTGFSRRKREESKKRQEEEEERQRNQQQQQDGGGGAKGNQDEWLRSDERTESLRASERHALRLGVPFAIALLFIAQGSRVLFGDEPSKDTIDHDEQLRLEGDDGRQGGDDLLLEEEGEKE